MPFYRLGDIINEIVIVGERGKQFVIDLRDSLQRRYELVRELKLSDSPKEEICAKYWYSKKNEAESLNPILLEKSDSISQRNERSKCNRTPEEIKRELDKALKTAFHTFYGGSFLLIHYLLHLGIVEHINALRVEKHGGIPVEKAVLALLHLGIVGKKRISRIENVTDQGLAVFAGFGKMERRGLEKTNTPPGISA